MLPKTFFIFIAFVLIIYKVYKYNTSHRKNSVQKKKQEALKRAKKLGLVVYEKESFIPSYTDKKEDIHLYIIDGKQKNK